MRFLTLSLIIIFFAACKNTGNDTNGAAGAEKQTAPGAEASPYVFTDTILVSLSAKDFAAVVKSKPNMPILDLRSPDMFAKGHIWRSTNMDANDKDFMRRISGLGRNQEYAIYDEFGDKSLEVAEEMKRLGFYRIYHLQKGLFNWGESGVPLQLH